MRKKKDIQPEPCHYTAGYLLSPVHPVTVYLIGCGGTGSQMLTNLARISASLKALGHPGLHVTAWDGDEITESNMGRQLFSSAEVGLNKATALITRINRFYGFQWESMPMKLNIDSHKLSANIIITCVDRVDVRFDVYKKLTVNNHGSPNHRRYYWMDLGNSKNTGQVVLGTCDDIKQPANTKGTVSMLPTIIDMFPNLDKFEKEDDTPSCSLAEALTKQDLFINSTLAQLGANIIWKMFRELKIKYNGVYLNLETLTTNPIKIA